VPEAEAKVHHVFLCETAGLSERANVPPESLAESWKIQGHWTATLEAGGHPDHGSKCRKGLRGLQRGPRGATMAAWHLDTSSHWPRHRLRVHRLRAVHSAAC
jgi:hypothetical protein